MKTSGFKGMGFGFSAVNAGQRNANVEPKVIAVSTEGNFRITPAVSRVLNIAHGDYVMFLSNVDNIDNAILNNDETIVAFCNEQGLELGTAEAAIAIHKEFDMWAIAKGVKELDAKGNYKTISERLTKKDKLKYVSQNFDNMLAAAMEQADDEVKEALSREGISKDEQSDILVQFVTARELPKFKGSKAANPAGLSGAGTTLNFTDANVWKQVKADMGDMATKMNREFDVDLDEMQDVEVNDGYKTVTVKALFLGASVDKEPNHVGRHED